MARLSRYTQKLFGSGAGPDQIAQFGSLFAGSPAFTTNPGTMMALSNWLTGWAGAAIGGNSPAIEDMNAVCAVLAYQLGYVMQSGIPEWDAGTTYYTGNIVNDGTGALYVSLQDANTDNAVTDPAWWTLIAGKVMASLGDLTYGGTNGALTRLAGNITTTIQFLVQQGTGLVSAAPTWRSLLSPTIQKFTTGSGTYTTPTGPSPIYIRVRMVGAGGGGQGSGGTGAGDGNNGSDSTFGTATASAGHGGGTNGGIGGNATLASGASGIAIKGGGGGGRSDQTGTSGAQAAGWGGNSALGGAPQGVITSIAGQDAAANSGSGGGGAGIAGNITGATGAGGGSGGYVDMIISNPSATYSYAVGSKGTGGTAGSSGQAGGAGSDGLIEVTEYYQ